MKPEKAKQYLADFHAEVKRVARGEALEKYVGGERKIVSGDRITGRYCGVLGVRMAKIWGVTNGTANRRLQALAGHGVIRDPRYGASHCDCYRLSEEESLKYVHEAIEYWKGVGYSQTEYRPDILEIKESVVA